MTNNDIISKLLQGTDEIHEVTVNDGKEDLKIQLRPLSSGELTKIKSIEKEPYTMEIGVNTNGKRTSAKKLENNADSNMTIGMGEFTESQAKAIYTAVAWSMCVEDTNITPEIVENFRKGVPEQIFRHVIEISNLTEEDLTVIKQFR